MGYRIGIDVGGTFTDCVLTGPGHPLVLTKAPTTPRDQSEGVLEGIRRLGEAIGLSLPDVLAHTETIVHGTTTADNTLIQMNGAVTGLITTEGHRDEIELRRGFKESIWDPALPPPIPIAQRRRRIGVPERLDYEGNVVVPLDEEAVRAALRRLKKLGTESVAVVFMFSFLNPTHEKRVRDIAAQEWPEVTLSLSHEVMPSAPEFERTSTTLVNAFVAPRIDRYLSRLVERVAQNGFTGLLLVMQSNGGIMAPEYILRRPVTVLGSGPTGGVIASCAVARQAKTTDFICADMGGTSYDVCLIRGGKPEIKSGWNWQHRYLVGLPMVDVQSIGAGGGSIASVIAGALQVGPQSAGAEPGPVCYRRGGRLATVTDANVVLGYLNADDFCGGGMTLDRDAARAAIEEQIASPLGIDVVAAANGIYRLVNANMANAIRRISAQRGVDPRGLTMVVYGGNGPVHATAQAHELGIRRVLVPKTSPAFSALGMVLADHVIDEMRAYITPVGGVDVDRLNAIYGELEAAARAMLEERRAASRAHAIETRLGRKDSFERLEVRRFVHLCYPGQTFDVAVPIAVHPLAAHDAPVSRGEWLDTIERFHAIHEELHTYAARDQEPILRGVRVTAAGIVEKPTLPEIGRSSATPRPKGKRRAQIDGKWVQASIYDGAKLRAGQRVRGPAIIEEPFTTIVLGAGQRAVLDGHGTYAIDLK